MAEDPEFPAGIPPEHASALAGFPPLLQDLVRAELAAGNRIMEICGGFPAPPVGNCVKLEKTVSTRPRQAGGGLDFYARNNSSYSGEFTDAGRFFFVLEPPLPPEPVPDMDAIRAELAARERAENAALCAMAERAAGEPPSRRLPLSLEAQPTEASMEGSVVERFLRSMEMNHERWHDGVGYDIELLRSAGEEERQQLESLLLGGGIRDWRHVEALAVLDTPKARVALRGAFDVDDNGLRVALLSHAPELFDEAEHASAIVSALGNTGIHDGLTQAMLLVEDFHPPEVIEALLRGVLNRDGATAGEFAAMLLYLHGKAAEPYDMEHRPFFLKFQDGDRVALFRQLCERIGVDVAGQERLMS